MKKWVLGLVLLFTLSSLPAFSANSPKPGSICSKQGITKTYKGKKYTCIKSGKKLLWNKGVAVKHASPIINPNPNPTPTPTPTYSPNENSNDSPEQQTDPQSVNLADKPCDKSGLRVSINSETYFECRYKLGKILEWTKLSTNPKDDSKLESPTNIAECKLRDSSGMYAQGGGANGFPVVNYGPKFPIKGILNLAILAVDFEEFPGDENIKEVLQSNARNLVDWFAYYSNGQLKVNVVTSEGWVRSKKSADFYERELGQRDKDLDTAKRIINQELVNLAPEQFNFKNIAEMFVIFPQAQNRINSFTAMEMDFSTRQGLQNFWVNAYLYGSVKAQQPPWALWVHGLLHTMGVAGHAPGNGWPINIMADQNGISYAPSAWDQFILEWLRDDQVYCIAREQVAGQIITLSPMEREDKYKKAVMIPLDNFRIVVIQSNGDGEWASKENADTRMPAGFYGVLTYLVDTRMKNDRSNELTGGISKTFCEEFYKGTRFCGELPLGQEQDNGNDPRFPKFAYYLPINGLRSNDWTTFTGHTPANDIIGNFIAVEGDKFTYQDITIEFLKTGDFNQVKISK